MCDSDERNMSHTSISAEDFKPAAGRFGPLQSKTKNIPFVSKYTVFFLFVCFLRGAKSKNSKQPASFCDYSHHTGLILDFVYS